ncbi:MAG: acyltransferase [Caulobacterales bacterium]
MKNSARHIAGIDFIRFAAAMAVLVYHLGLVGWSHQSTTIQLVGGDTFLSPIWPGAWFAFIGVQVFFVISGVVIAFSASKATAFTFLRDRIVRLAPAVWICAIGSLAIYLAYNLLPADEAIKAFVREVVFWPRGDWLDVVVWTLGIEISFYALVFALLCFQRFSWITHLAAVLAIVSLCFQATTISLGCLDPLVMGACQTIHEQERTTQLALLNHGGFFAIGIFLWLWLIEHRAKGHWWWAALALISSALQIADFTLLIRHSPWFGDRTIPDAVSIATSTGVWAIATGLIAYSIIRNENLQKMLGASGGMIVRNMGLATYPLYLIHVIWGSFLIRVLKDAGASLPVAIIGGMALIIGVSFLIARHVEPPLQRWLRSGITRIGDWLAQIGWLKFLFDRRPGANSAA